jgi:hypothetical protein
LQETSKPGPKPFAPTRAQRRKVMLYLAGGMPEPQIAAVLGIVQNTLRKHFADELAHGRAVKMAANLERLEAAADKGNVTAMKHLDARFQSAAAEAAFIDPAPKAERLGKKQLAAIAAETAGDGTEWGDDLAGTTVN